MMGSRLRLLFAGAALTPRPVAAHSLRFGVLRVIVLPETQNWA